MVPSHDHGSNFRLRADSDDPPTVWLEDVTGEKSSHGRTSDDVKSKAELEARPEFKAIHERLLAIYNSRERIPYAAKRGDWLYNFWQDEKNPRGLWRRTTLAEYRKAEPAWEVVLDIDKLNAAENTNWVWKGSQCLFPNYDLCLVSLSHGGADAVEVREFDLTKKSFVKDGFVLPESKGEVAWRNRDSLYIARDFGPGTLTQSGYPRIVKEWKRGTPLADAKVIFEGQVSDVSSSAFSLHEKGRQYDVLRRGITFWESENFLRVGDKWVPSWTCRSDARITAASGLFFVSLKTPWKPSKIEFKAGSLIAVDLDKFMAGGRDFDAVFESNT